MNTLSVTIHNGSFAGDLANLVQHLTESDLAKLSLAYRGLSGLHAVFSQLLDPKQSDAAEPTASVTPQPNWTAKLFRLYEDLGKRVAAQEDLANRMAAEIAGLHKLVTGMAERITAQSELLSERAEGPPSGLRSNPR